jgi:pseudomonalisin
MSRSSMRRRGVAASVAVLALGLAGTTRALATTATTPLASTATKAIQITGATAVGAASPSRLINVDVALKPRDPAAQLAALKAMYTPGSATYDHFLTPAQYAAAYAPTASAVASVTRYLSSQGLTGITVLPNNLFITASGTVASVSRAFHTSISDFRLGTVSFYGNTTPALVPAALSSVVEAVVGLNDFPFATPHPATKSAGSPVVGNEVPPGDFRNTYDVGSTPTGSGTAIALFTEGNLTNVLKDLRLAESKNHLPQVAVTQIDVGPQSSDVSGQDEFDLDTQSSTAMATTVKHLYLYNIGSLVDSNIDEDFAQFVAQDKAVAMSASIGGCDIPPYLDGSMITTDILMQEGAMQGQTLFASSGDNGFGCAFIAATGVPSSFPGTNWPASGEFTTAVGGTTLLSDSSANRVQEIGWIGSGGGVSEVENPGWWTEASDPAFDAEFVTGGRAVPDISLNGDPNGTAAAIYVNGAVIGVGGTSLSSPLMLGTWARLESTHANSLGMASIDIYRLYDKVNPGTAVPGSPVPAIIPTLNPGAVKGFTDITVGTNGYPCLPGYDFVTGVGVPDVAALNKAI